MYHIHEQQQNFTENFPYALPALPHRRMPILTNCGVSTELALLGSEDVEEEGLLAKGGRKTPYEREFGKTGRQDTCKVHFLPC